MNYQIVVITKDPKRLAIAAHYFDLLEADGLASTLFYDGSVKTRQEFIDLASSSNILLGVVIDKCRNQPAGHFHLSNFSGQTASFHFSILRAYHGGETLNIARDTLHQVFDIRRPSGQALVTTLIGYTPVKNKLAIRLLKRVGFQKVYILPDACEDGLENFQDAVVSVFYPALLEAI